MAAGGTSGWFPDNVGGKPWFDTSGDQAALWAFANAQSTWAATWPSSSADRAMRVYVLSLFSLRRALCRVGAGR